jgi:hypothetical protein
VSGTHNRTFADRYREKASPEDKARDTAEALQERERLRAEAAERRQNRR